MGAIDHLLDQLNDIAGRPFGKATILPREFYTSDDVLAREQDLIFAREWHCVGRAGDIPNPGDYVTDQIGPQPVFTLRGKDGSIRTFANVCRHRMMRLLEGSGNTKRIVCPYHSWAYGHDGTLIGAPHAKSFEQFDKTRFCLPEIRTEIWQGFIYVTLNQDAPSVASRVAPLDDMIDRFGMADYVPIVTQDHVWDTNWKLLTENYMESYHLPYIHKGTVGGHFPVADCIFPDESPGDYTYSTFTKAEGSIFGRAHPDNTRLEGAWRYTNVLPVIFPAHMFTLAPDYMWYLSLRPNGTGQVHIRYGASLAPEVVAAMFDPETEMQNAVDFLDKVNLEDKDVVEAAYRGAQAPLTEAGPIHQLERAIHHFIIYLAGRLAGGEGPVWEAAE